METTLLSPVMLWRDFNATEPLKETIIGNETYRDFVYSDVYFSGRETSDGRVRVYGILAKNRLAGKKANRSAILILPDADQTVNLETINIYVEQGYTVLMIDYRGEWDGVDNYTKYPESVAYANYKKAIEAIDTVPKTAKETCWYEWAAVAKYAVSFLSAQPDIDNIGVLGIRNGANVGWILCGTDARVNCFVPLFGMGWRAYKGIFKQSQEDLKPDDEKLKYLAGVDAHAYAQYVKCPVFYMTATNSPEFDFDRATDTISRVSKETDCFVNYAPRLKDVLDKNCRRNADLFFAKYLLGFRAVLPLEPTLTASVFEGVLSCDVELDVSEIKRPKNVTFYVAEDSVNPSYREWKIIQSEKSVRENKRTYTYNLEGNCEFISMFAVCEYRSGITVSSKVVIKKAAHAMDKPKRLLYSTKDKVSTFAPSRTKEKAAGGLFFEDEGAVSYLEGGSGISGLCSPYGLVTHSVNSRDISLTDNSMFVFDVYTEEFCLLKVVLMAQKDELTTVDYTAVVEIKGGFIWQNITIKASDFKSDLRISLKDFSKVCGIRFETETKCVFNNLLVI